MKKAILSLVFLLLAFSGYAQYTVRGGQGNPYQALKNDSEAIEVYVLNGLAGAEISYAFSGGEAPEWYRYRVTAGESEPVASEVIGTQSTVRQIEDGYGYYIGTQFGPVDRNVIWIIDYSRHPSQIYSLGYDTNGSNPCRKVNLLPDIEAEPFFYRTYRGEERLINRMFFLEYDDLLWSEDEKKFQDIHVSTPVANNASIEINTPLKNTEFTLRGDTIASYFGEAQTVTTESYRTLGLEVHTYAYYTDEDGSEQSLSVDDMNTYQAPLSVRLEAYSNMADGMMYIWKIYKIDSATQEREDSETFRYESAVCEPNFTESGSYEMVLEVVDVNGSGICSYVSDPYEYRISFKESALELPNAFSPGSSYGANDIYKVYYKSLVSFKASVYNRWGNLLYTWTDPDQGWDGRVNGKFVATGVYYVVVEAKGADGKEYKENSDINILRRGD